MTYLMIVRAPEVAETAEAAATPESAQQTDVQPTPEDASPDAWFEDVTRRGVRLGGDRLRPTSDATCVRVRDGGLEVDLPAHSYVTVELDMRA